MRTAQIAALRLSSSKNSYLLESARENAASGGL